MSKIKRGRRPEAGKVMMSLLIFCFLLFLLLAALMIMGEISGSAGVLATLISMVTVAISAYSVYMLMRMSAMLATYEQSTDNLEDFNEKLRAQRHDFKNHMQVISGLLEMDEYDEARNYISRVNGDLMKVGRALRTSEPSVNALLEAKHVLGEQQGVAMGMDVNSTLDNLPVESWEFCRILGNLIDNAIEAAQSSKYGEVKITLSDVAGGVMLRVTNTGKPVPEDMRGSLFEDGVSTKGEGRGTGLSIVKELCEGCGGSVAYNSSEGATVFEVFLPYYARTDQRSMKTET